MRAPEGLQRPPPILSEIFAEFVCLRELLGEKFFSLPGAVQALIGSILICVPAGTPWPPSLQDKHTHYLTPELLHDLVMEKHRKWRLSGYTTREDFWGDYNSKSRFEIRHEGIHIPYPEESFLRREEVGIIHKILGDSLTLFLLTRTSWFAYENPNFYHQIVGIPLYRFIGKQSQKSAAQVHQVEPVDAESRRSSDKQDYDNLRWINHISIKTGFIYYQCSREGFPVKYVLVAATPDDAGARKLLEDIFMVSELDNVLSTEQTELLCPLFTTLIKNHRRLKYRAVLNSYIGEQSAGTLPQLLSRHTPHCQVSYFLTMVLKKLLPEELLGKNRDQLTRDVRKLVSAGKMDTLHPFQFTNGMKTRNCKWLKKFPHPHLVMTIVIHWIVIHLLRTLRAYFYVTESALHKKEPFYYSIPVWNKIRDIALQDLVNRSIFRLVPQGESAYCNPMGVCTIRFLPKTSSLRPIIHFHAKTYRVLRNNIRSARLILNYLVSKNPEMMGSNIKDFNEVCWKVKELPHKNPLYIVKIDLKDCFNSLNHEILIHLIENIFKYYAGDIEYFQIFKYMITQQQHGKSMKFLKTKWLAAPDSFSILDIMMSAEKLNVPTVALPLGDADIYGKSAIVKFIKDYIRLTIAKCGERHYQFTQGLGQGGALSALLCNLYLGQAERRVQMDLHKGELLFRVIDDFLFISPDLERAKHFLSFLPKVAGYFNLFINPSKVATNFPAEGVTSISPESPLSWAGISIQPHPLRFEVDYSWAKNIKIEYSTTSNIKKAGDCILNKIPRLVILNLNSLILDTQVNGFTGAVKNLYLKFQLVASRIHVLQTKLPPERRAPSPNLFPKIVSLTWRLFIKKVQHLRQAHQLHFQLSRQTVRWICLVAFQHKMSRHPDTYGDGPIKWLKSEVGKYKKKRCGWRKIMKLNSRIFDY